jgi:hypothetical protein
MKAAFAALVCIATLVGIDRLLFKGNYIAALKSSASESAMHFR